MHDLGPMELVDDVVIDELSADPASIDAASAVERSTPVASAPACSVEALSIDAELAGRLAAAAPGAPERTARIHSVYDRTVNVVDGTGYLFCLADASLDDAPRTARVPSRALVESGIAVGDIVRIDGAALVLRPGPRAVAVRLDHAAPWQPSRADFSGQTTERLREQSAALVRLLAAPRPRSRFEERSEVLLSARIERLGEALSTREDSRIAAAATELIGLGAGLTPSGDDVLVGLSLLAAQRGMLLGTARTGLGIAASRASLRTPPVSAAMLAEAAEGRARQPLHELLDALSRDAATPVGPALARVARIGHSSGFDMLRGVRLGLDAEVRLREAAPHDSPILRGPR